MDYGEEQQMELEALEAILGEDGVLGYTGMVPAGWDAERSIRKIKLEPDVDDLEVELSFELLFQQTATYPETEPHLKVSNPRGLNNADVDALTATLQCAAQENLGMASIFAVMQAGKDWLDTKAGLTEVVDPIALKKQQEEAAERARAAQRAQGTPVTVESFNKWRADFEEEMRKREEASASAEKSKVAVVSMTGKEWFLEKDRGEGDEEIEALDDELAELDIDDDVNAETDSDAISNDVDEDDDDDDDDEDFLDELEGELEGAS